MKVTRQLITGVIAGMAVAVPVTVTGPTALASPTRAAASAPAIATRSVTAVLIDPWGGCDGAEGWKDLAANWAMYGSTRLVIDSKTFCSAATPVTYDALVASKAKVLVFSDTAGGTSQLTSAEIAAITQYVQAGHNIVGTFLTFVNKSWDNSGLAPLFGLAASFSDAGQKLTADYNIPSGRYRRVVFRSVPDPYDSGGYQESQTPPSGYWTMAALSGAQYLARTANDRGAITIYNNPGDRYRAVYTSNMPEFAPNTTDLQFLYNALTLSR